MRLLFASACAVVALLLVVSSGTKAAEQGDAKYTIKDVMKAAHKDEKGKKNSSLLAKVASGQGDKSDAEKLLAYYVALGGNNPPIGEKDQWKKRTDDLVQAAKEVVQGKDGAGAKLTKAANCANCHKDFKTPPKN